MKRPKCGNAYTIWNKCWGYQPTLANVDQVDYHMPGLLKKAGITRSLSSAKEQPNVKATSIRLPLT